MVRDDATMGGSLHYFHYYAQPLYAGAKKGVKKRLKKEVWKEWKEWKEYITTYI